MCQSSSSSRHMRHLWVWREHYAEHRVIHEWNNSVEGNPRSSLTTLTCSSTHLVASSCDLWAPPGLAVSALDAVVLSLSLLSRKNQVGLMVHSLTKNNNEKTSTIRIRRPDVPCQECSVSAEGSGDDVDSGRRHRLGGYGFWYFWHTRIYFICPNF